MVPFRKLIAVAMIALVALLASCSAIDRGTITAKEYEPQRIYTTTTCVIVGKVPVCTPHTTIDDEDWRFDIQNEKETGWVYVTEEEFEEYEVGDFYAAQG